MHSLGVKCHDLKCQCQRFAVSVSSCVRRRLYPCLVFDFLSTSFVIDFLRFSNPILTSTSVFQGSDISTYRDVAFDPILKQKCLYS